MGKNKLFQSSRTKNEFHTKFRMKTIFLPKNKNKISGTRCG
jgi:hypothetical protein